MGEVEHAPEAKPGPEPAKPRGRFGLAGIAAALAIAGAVWYGIQSLVAAWVYDPLGVQPREVGLGSSALLTQATVGLAAFLVLVLLVLVIFFFVSVKTEVNDFFDLLITLPLVGIAALGFWLLAAPAILGTFAWEARGSLKDGERPGFIPGFPAPWRGEVAFLRPAGDPRGLKVPPCALYLGQADGTVVLYDASQERALRIPASAVVLELEHDLKSCPGL